MPLTLVLLSAFTDEHYMRGGFCRCLVAIRHRLSLGRLRRLINYSPQTERDPRALCQDVRLYQPVYLRSLQPPPQESPDSPTKRQDED